jgi:hypothetical protein
MKTIILGMSILLVGCANSQQLAQQHWMTLSKNSSGMVSSHSTGVNISTVTVNGTSYQVITPVK